VVDAPRGNGGFGYDPHLLPSVGKTAAELSAEEKNTISHRAGAAGTGGPPADCRHQELRMIRSSRRQRHAGRIPLSPADNQKLWLAGPDRPARLAAAFALRAHPMVRAQMPVLRFQLARGTGQAG
jgi:hypothetical protein